MRRPHSPLAVGLLLLASLLGACSVPFDASEFSADSPAPASLRDSLPDGASTADGDEPSGSRRIAAEDWERHEFESIHMAIPFRLVFYAPNPSLAEAAARAAFDRIEQLNSLLSDYDPESDLSRFSRVSDTSAGLGQSVEISNELGTVLHHGLLFAQASNGAFDPTVGPVVQLWRRARRQHVLPSPERIQQALDSVGWEHLIVEESSDSSSGWFGRLHRTRMRLDLGGIAKGYALDEAARILGSFDIQQHLVAGAGDIRVGAAPPGRPGWRLEIGALEVPDAPPPRRLCLVHAALCSSGDLFQFVELDGVRYSHIVDPRTGLGLTDHRQVSVVAGDAITADALATALSVVAEAEGRALARQFQAEVLVLRRPEDRVEHWESPGFASWESDCDPGPLGLGSREAKPGSTDETQGNHSE